MEQIANNTELSRKPLVAIVGRPNVGKSTLFNRLVGERRSIVEDVPGVTRDRIYADTQWDGREFSLVDTGGFDPEGDEEEYPSLIKEQIEIAIEEADLIVFVLDGKDGVMPHDEDVIDLLRRVTKPVIFTVNKIDDNKHEQAAFDFHSLGIDELIPISAQQGRNINELLDKIVAGLPEQDGLYEEEEEGVVKIAVLGKPNAGKSTLINRLLGEDRLITSPVPGTTRDTIDSYIEKDGNKYLFIDTAGIRRKSKISFSVEKHSVFRAVRAMERADLALLMIDGGEGPTHQDARLARLISDKGRGCIVLLNKWDLVPSEVSQTPDIEGILKDNLIAVDYAPVLIISALTGRGTEKIFKAIDSVYKNFSQRISTKKLNNFIRNIVENTPPPIHKGKEIKFYYISQPMTKQPTFVIFTNEIKGVPENYKRFLQNRLRHEFELEGTPIKIIFRSERKKD